jgi:GAF domain-containing protein/HAMP domain-containing protein
MSFALRSQINALDEWITEKESVVLEISLDPDLLSELDELALNSGDIEAVESTQQRLLDLLRLNQKTGFEDLLIVDSSSEQILSSTSEEQIRESLGLPSDLEPGSASTIPLTNHNLFSPGTAKFLVVKAVEPGNLVLAAVLAEDEIARLLDALGTYWPIVDDQGEAKGRALLVLPPDSVMQSPPGAITYQLVSEPAHPVFSSPDSFEARSTSYDSAPGEVVLTTFSWLEGREIGVVVERPQADILAGLIEIAPFLGVMILFTVGITILVIILVTNRIFKPLDSLAEFARRISNGEWHFRVPEDQDEELGGLASSLNRMATELGQLYQSLEDRVEDRTQQIKTASEVARAVITIPNLDELLRQAVELIKSRFGYDHVSIFLLDRGGSNAILRETSSDDIESLRTIGYKLQVGSQSVVGQVTQNNEPRISSDTPGSDGVELDELLPGAQSEVAIPLQVVGNSLGALAIQSFKPEAFKSEDIEVLQTLADQLSAAIENVRLAQESTNAAERARLVSEITSQISGLMEPEKVLRATGQALHKALGEAEIMIRLVYPEEEIESTSE